MTKLTLLVGIFAVSQVQSQIIRGPLNVIRNLIPESIIESPRPCIEVPPYDISRNIIDIPRNVIDIPRNIIDIPRNIIEIPRNVIDPRSLFPPIIAEPQIVPSTALVTDCTPSVCKNLANTIQLMIVCSLLQNYNEDQAKLAKLKATELVIGPNVVGQNLPAFLTQVGPNLVPTCANVAPRLVTNVPNVPLNPNLLSNVLKMLGNIV